VELLIRLGLVERSDTGGYSVSSAAVTTGDDLRSLALAQFHRDMTDHAKRAIDEFAPTAREISGVTMSLSTAGFEKVRSEIRAFRKRIMDIAAADGSEDRAYQMSLHLFPLSKSRGAK
jgi:uncharacterized protein (TIGR02147 family)